MAFNIDEELKKLPARPGVYLMHNAKDEIIYVGKAVSLKNRVRQYFQSSRNKGLKIEQMVPQIARFEYIVTDSELEALVLECNLIKEYRPKYNTMLKDDKSYPFIQVTVQEEFPRVLFARRMKKDKSKYFGPYTSAGAVKETIDLVRKLYCLRACSKKLPADQGKERPCLYYHIHQCKAPCQGWITPEEYRQQVDDALNFLNGNFQGVIQELTVKMEQASEELRFEEACEYRDLIESVRRIGEHQKITGSSGEDRDVVALALDREDAVAQIFFIRDGKLIGRDHFYLRVAAGEERSGVLLSFLKQFYAGTPFIPRELMLSDEIEDHEVLEEWLGRKRGQKVHIKVPKKGSKEKLVELAAHNAQIILNQDRERLKREEGRTIGAVKEIGRWLSMEPPERIEAYDISNISGFQSVGSMVVYEKGKPKRADYRKFRIKSVEGPNDYASMEEVLSRRFQRGIDADSGFEKLPDLIMMDGGQGQVNVALEVLNQMGLQIPVCGMVKDDNHRTRGLYFNNCEIPIDRNGEGFHLITRIQDEAHRFAIEYHRLLRSKGQVHSVLDDIPGIGPGRRKELMRHYQSLDEIRNAGLEELRKLPSMNERAARSVYDYFHKSENHEG
ncbi:excinuclease ABC subunit UvrC [Wansuia hejianensis]|uniref:UvrABC system protein C n=1 Tax=Wansuia hejianensis TaxID=2763667 RepID=A0A7G9G937_9FIRM|nr:excinuclease ABC subunit UvrC [Wansuia hejianensis]QNM07319.1 excinuclease ABC subunit UvrC [Wansuia hejianensis]RHV84757.1 excinuclease ABC subunit UvrC [Lachnospiraceae bacterium OF09-33XD]